MDLIDDVLSGSFGHVGGGLGPHRQNERLLRFHTPLGRDVLLAERVRVTEAIGPGADGQAPAGARIEVEALSSDTHLELKALQGQPALLELLTQQSRTQLRPWHGHVTAVTLLGSDGGFARYRIVIEPWLGMLAHRRDSWVFQDMTVMEILDEVFADYQGQGRLMPAWRYDLADPSVYPQRSLCVQYQETDLQFVQRLMREEGLVCWWEYQGDPGGSDLGKHTLVIADHNGAIQPNRHPRVRYTQSHVSLPEDSLIRWNRARRVHTASLTLASRDHRSVSLRPQAVEGVEVTVPELQLHDVPGGYAYETNDQGKRCATRQMEAFDALREQVQGRGSWRTAEPGTRFTLLDHPVHDGTNSRRDEFIITSVVHRARSNVAGDAKARLAAPDALVRNPEDGINQIANASDEPEYQCELTAQPSRLPVRMGNLDEHGLPDPRLHPRPTAVGVQTALVVGLGEPVHTDRDHRIKVQFHWQRGGSSSHRLAHPNGDNAPASDASGTWVRVGEAVAGHNWGSNFIPRLGQEVLVGFEAGDIDRPIVIGVVYNGLGQPDAQGNQVAAGAAGAVGSADAWFPGSKNEGKLQAHQHTQVHAGYKSQELSASQGGFGGYNQLVFDDTPAEGRIELYSSTDQTRLQLGHLLHQVDNRRLQHRGHGADLATAAWGAVRAGMGQLISAHKRPASVQASKQIDVREPINQIDLGQQLIHTLAESAQQHKAKTADEPDVIGAKRPDTGRQLPAEKGMYATLDSIETTATHDGQEGDEEHIGGGHGTVPAWGRADLVTAAPAGIGTFTPANTILTANQTVTISAGQDIQQIAQANHATAVKDAAILYTYGKAQNPTKPNKETGIKLHAATGNVQTQSQTGATKIAAQKRIHVVSTHGKITIAAPKHVQLFAAGAAIRLEGGRVSNTGPGSVLYKASLKIFNSPGANVPYVFPGLVKGKEVKREPGTLKLHHRYVDIGQEALEGVKQGPWKVIDALGKVHRGVLDGKGKATVAGLPAGLAQVFFGPDPRDPWDEPSYYDPYEWMPPASGVPGEPEAAPPKPKNNDPEEQAEAAQTPEVSGAASLLATGKGIDMGASNGLAALGTTPGWSGAMPTAMPTVPSTPALSGMPSMSSLPGLPSLPAVPSKADLQDKLQDMGKSQLAALAKAQMPGLSTPNPAAVPGLALPQVSGSALPQLPGLALPQLPAGGIGSLPDVAQLPNLALPTLPKASASLPAMPSALLPPTLIEPKA
jgi:type VI secretion system secreted protein VgrG